MGFFNKYPYTDFHELNADWVISQTKSLLDRIDAAEATVEAMESRVSTLEGQMTAAQNNILGLQASVNSLDSRLDTQEDKMASVEADLVEFDQHINGLEAMDIRDMTVLTPQTDSIPYIGTPTSVKLRFKAQSYIDGNEASSDWYEMNMPMASPQNAGMMYAADAEKLENLDTVTRVTIFDRDMYQEIVDPDGPIYQSKFAQQAAQGKFEFFQNNGQKAFFLYAEDPELDALIMDSYEIMKIVIPEAYRPARKMSWDFAAISHDDDDLHGMFRFYYDGAGMLTMTFFGSNDFVQGSTISMDGFYMPFM